MANEANVDRTGGPNPPKSAKAPAKANATTAPPGAPVTRRARRTEVLQERRRERITVKERQKQRKLINYAALGLTAVILIGLIGWWGVNYLEGREGRERLAEVAEYENAGFQHADGEITYPQSPPVGGTHSPYWQTCGYYAAPIPNWHAVHSLEHGAVWITYDPNLPQEDVDQLREIAESMDFILVSPYPGNPAPVVATAWDHQLYLDGVDDPGLDAFIEEYRLGEQTPELGASCSNGMTGTLAST